MDGEGLIETCIDGDGTAIAGETRTVECDFIGSSSGYNPIVHLHCQSGAKLDFDAASACFVPAAPIAATPTISAGGAKGLFSLNAGLLFIVHLVSGVRAYY